MRVNDKNSKIAFSMTQDGVQGYMQRLENTEWMRMFKMFLSINEKAERTAQQVNFFKQSHNAEFAFVFDWLEGNGFTKTQLVLEVESFRRLNTKAFDYTSYIPEFLSYSTKDTRQDWKQAHLEGQNNDNKEAFSSTKLGALLKLVPQLLQEDGRADLLRTNAKLNADLTVYEGQLEEMNSKLNLLVEENRQMKSTLSNYKNKHNELMVECKARLATRKDELIAKEKEISKLREQLEVLGRKPDSPEGKSVEHMATPQQTQNSKRNSSLALSGSLTSDNFPHQSNPNSNISACSHLSIDKVDRHNIILEVGEGAAEALALTIHGTKEVAGLYSHPNTYQEGIRALMKSAYTNPEPSYVECSKGVQAYIDTDEVFLATQELRIRTHQLQSELGIAHAAKEASERELRSVSQQLSDAVLQMDKLQEELRKANERRFTAERALGDVSAADRANEESIANLNGELSRAKAGQARLQSELAEATDTIEIYAKRLKEKEVHLMQVSSELGSLNVQVATLNSTCETLKQELDHLREQYTLLSKNYESAQTQLAHYESNASVYERGKAQLTEGYERKCSGLVSQIQELKHELQLQHDSFSTLREESLQIQKQHGKLTLEHNDLLTKLSLQESQLKKHSMDAERQAAERKDLLNALAKEEEKARRLEVTYETLKTQYTDTYNYSLSLSETNQKLNEEIHQVRKSEVDGREALQELEKKLAQSTQSLTQTQEQISQQDIIINEQRQKIQELTQLNKKLEEDKAHLSKEFEIFKTSDDVVISQTAKKQLMERELELSSIKQRYDKLEHEHRAEVSLLTAKNADLLTSYEAIKTKSSELAASLKRLTDEKASALKAHIELEEELDKKVVAINACQLELEDSKRAISKLQSTITTLQEDLTTAKRDGAEKVSRIGELELTIIRLENKEMELANANTTITSYRSTIQSLQEKLTRMEVDASVQQQAYLDLEQQLSAFSESREDQTTAITKLQERNKTITVALSNAHKKYESLIVSHEQLVAQYKALELDYTEATENKGLLEKVKKEAETMIGEKDAEIKQLVDRLTLAEESLKTQDEKMRQEIQNQSEEYLVMKHQYQVVAEQERRVMEEQIRKAEQDWKLKQETLESKVEDLQRQIEFERNRNDTLTASLMLVQPSQRISEVGSQRKTDVSDCSTTPTIGSPGIQTMTVKSVRNSVDEFQSAMPPKDSSHKNRSLNYVEDSVAVRSPQLAGSLPVKKTVARTQSVQCTILVSTLQSELNSLIDEHNNLSSAFGALQTDYEEKCSFIVQLEQRVSVVSEEAAEKAMELERAKAEISKLSSEYYIADSLASELNHKVKVLEDNNKLLEVKLQDANITESNTVIALEEKLKEKEDQYTVTLKEFNALSVEYENMRCLLKEAEERWASEIREKGRLVDERETDLHSLFDKIVLLYNAYKLEYQLDSISIVSGGKAMARSALATTNFVLTYSLDNDGLVGSLKVGGVGKSTSNYIKASSFNPFHSANDGAVLGESTKRPTSQIILTKSQKSVSFSAKGDDVTEPTWEKNEGEQTIILDRIAVLRMLDVMIKKFDMVIQNLKTLNEQAILELKQAKAHSADMTAQYTKLSGEYSILLEQCANGDRERVSLQEKHQELLSAAEEAAILRKQLEALQDNYQAAINGVAEAHAKMSEAEHEILRLSHANANLTSIVTEQKQQIGGLNEKYTELLSSIQDKEALLLAKESEMSLFAQQMSEKTAKIVDLEAQLLRIDGSESSMKQMIAEKNAALDLLKENLGIVTQEKVELTTKAKDLIDKLNSVTASFTKATRDISKLEMTVMEQESSLKTAEAEVSHLTAEKDALRAKGVKLQQENSDLVTKQIALQAEIERLQLWGETQKLDIARLTNDKDSLSSEYAAFKSASEEVSKDFETVRTELTACKVKLASCTEAQREIDLLKERLRDSEEDCKATSDEMKFIAISKEKIEGELKQLRLQLDDMKLGNEALNKQIANLNSDYITEQTRATRLESDLAIANNRVKILIEEKEELSMTVANQKEVLAQRQNLSKDLMESMTASGRSLKDQEDALEKIKETYEEELHKLSSELLRSNESKKRLTEEKAQLAQEVANLRMELREIAQQNHDVHLSLEQQSSKHQLDLQTMMLDYDRRIQELQREKLGVETAVSLHINEISKLQFENERLMERLAVLEAQNIHKQTRVQFQSVPSSTLTSGPTSGTFPPLPSAMRLSTTTTVQQGLPQQVSLPPHILHQQYPTNDAPVTLSALQSRTGGEIDSGVITSDSVVDLIGSTSVTTSSLPPYKPITQANQVTRLQAGNCIMGVKPNSDNAPRIDIYKDFDLPPDVSSLIETYANDNSAQISMSVNVLDVDTNIQELEVTSSVLQPSLPNVLGGEEEGINVIDTVDVLSNSHEVCLDTDIDELIGKYT
ncbi:Hypothetical protein GLP15_2036 [Giardia lamblia P15]|uniref:Uncharacterized protein n=1 Tax=Giardia intestinalis (strain P15) TaxID=658858 RepID=E1EZY9_GIAIA|nr:Hypothetical protein GLP15_2036 [Giardia lamblia P15]